MTIEQLLARAQEVVRSYGCELKVTRPPSRAELKKLLDLLEAEGSHKRVITQEVWISAGEAVDSGGLSRGRNFFDHQRLA